MAIRTTVQIPLPAMGESVTEGTVLEWRKQVGEHVEADEPIVDVSTDKVDAEVPAPASGTLTAIHVQADETVAVGSVLGEIAVNGGAPAAKSGNGGDPAAVDEGEAEPAQAAAAEAPQPTAAEPRSAAEDAAIAAQASAESDALEEGELVDVTIPSMGESVSEGTLLEWLDKVGDRVKEQQGLAGVSTDKVAAELPSPVPGIVAELLAEPDETVRVGQVVCRISPMSVTAEPQ